MHILLEFVTTNKKTATKCLLQNLSFPRSCIVHITSNAAGAEVKSLETVVVGEMGTQNSEETRNQTSWWATIFVMCKLLVNYVLTFEKTMIVFLSVSKH